MTTLPAYALSDDAHPERAAEWEALTARAEQAEAQFAALVEATRALLDDVGSAVVADAEVLRHGDLRASVRAALAATPATLAGQVRARVLRGAADQAMREAGEWGRHEDAREWTRWLRALADEAERAK